MPHDKPLRVLIVEDDEDTRANISDLLELDNFACDRAATLRDGMRKLVDGRYFAIILDRKLPDGQATDYLPEIRKLAPDAAIVIATGYGDLDGAIAAVRAGASDYILKPINPDALRTSLARIVETKTLGEHIARSEKRLRAMFENALDGILILNDRGEFIEVNPAACSQLGYTFDELLQKKLRDVVRFSDFDSFETAWSSFLREGSKIGECKFNHKNGMELDMEWRAVVNFLPGQHLVSIRDITERKRAEQRARQAERLAAIGETMAALVHESRNALQRSRACLEMLAVEVQDRPDALDLVERTQRAQERLQQLYEEVRQYAAPLHLELEPHDLRSIWREAWEHLTHARNEKNLHLCDDEAKTDLRCDIDRVRISQVMLNILENAIQASPPAGQIVVKCKASQLGGRPAIEVAIQDQGPGVAIDQRRRIFEPFFTTKSKGTGLGMAIVQRIVQAHGGHVAVGERNGPGAEIIITLPRGHV